MEATFGERFSVGSASSTLPVANVHVTEGGLDRANLHALHFHGKCAGCIPKGKIHDPNSAHWFSLEIFLRFFMADEHPPNRRRYPRGNSMCR